MIIKSPIDIEEEIRTALVEYLNAYVRPLPANYNTPNILIKWAGGSSKNTIDSFTVSLEARAEDDAEANEYLRLAIGILEEQTANQHGALRGVAVNSLGSWGVDPVRPDLSLATATVIVTAHRDEIEINKK